MVIYNPAKLWPAVLPQRGFPEVQESVTFSILLLVVCLRTLALKIVHIEHSNMIYFEYIFCLRYTFHPEYGFVHWSIINNRMLL